MDGWSLVLLAAAAFLAVTGLARLMKTRHDALVTRLRSQWRQEQDRRGAEDRRRWREERQKHLRKQLEKQIENPSDRAA
jgi:hypothetical protein